MKAILISIQPKWCELIATGEKTVEVRKSKPKIEVPFKCYIYATKSGDRLVLKNDKVYEIAKELTGKIIGEFVCDKFVPIAFDNGVYYTTEQCGRTYMTVEEARKYGKSKPLYAWNISNLIIYEKTKELSEFRLYNGRAYYDEELKLPMPTHEITRPPQSWYYVEELEGGVPGE